MFAPSNIDGLHSHLVEGECPASVADDGAVQEISSHEPATLNIIREALFRPLARRLFDFRDAERDIQFSRIYKPTGRIYIREDCQHCDVDNDYVLE